MPLVIINNDISPNIVVGHFSVVALGVSVIVLWGIKKIRIRKLLLSAVLLICRTAIAAIVAYRRRQVGMAGFRQLRFVTGIVVRTEADMKRLIQWADRHNESLTDIRASGHYFDFETPGLREDTRLPSPWTLATGVLTALIALSLAMAFITAYFSDRAILKSNRTGALLTVQGHTAKPISNGEGIDLAACGRPALHPARDTGFATTDIDGLCSAFSSLPDMQRFVRTAILSQRAVFASFAILLLCATKACYSWVKRATAALAMAERLRRKSPES